MSKRNRKKTREKIVKYESINISQEKMIQIQTEAYYRALKRIDDEKNNSNEIKPEKKKYKRNENVLLVLNVLFWPWKINKKFCISKRIYDSILVLFVSGVLKFVGGIIWIYGIYEIIYKICNIVTLGITDEVIIFIPIVIFFPFLGSILVLAGEEFEKETDSNKIYAYSASIIALISCVISVIAMIGL